VDRPSDEVETDGMTSLLQALGISIEGRLQSTNLDLSEGSLTAVIGPNGGGKTSLLRALARVQATSGMVLIDGENVDAAPPQRRRRMLSFLPAARDMAWPIAARDVIALGLSRPDPVRVEEVIATLGLAELAERPTDHLSTGERARVLLGRALAERPRVLLLDEPLSNLDPYWALRVLGILRAAAGQGAAVLVSVHDLSLLDHFDRALLLGNGRIQGDGPPAEVLRSPAFSSHFGVERCGAGWRISPARAEDRQSSP
jgi:iron complex transport system ATP-binding protein